MRIPLHSTGPPHTFSPPPRLVKLSCLHDGHPHWWTNVACNFTFSPLFFKAKASHVSPIPLIPVPTELISPKKTHHSTKPNEDPPPPYTVQHKHTVLEHNLPQSYHLRTAIADGCSPLPVSNNPSARAELPTTDLLSAKLSESLPLVFLPRQRRGTDDLFARTGADTYESLLAAGTTF